MSKVLGIDVSWKGVKKSLGGIKHNMKSNSGSKPARGKRLKRRNRLY